MPDSDTFGGFQTGPSTLLFTWQVIDRGVSEELKAWARGLMLQCSLKAVSDCQHAFTSTDFRPELMRLTLPTLVIQGDADRSAPPALTGRRTADLVTGADYRIYPGAPHGLVFTHTERLNADIAALARSARMPSR